MSEFSLNYYSSQYLLGVDKRNMATLKPRPRSTTHGLHNSFDISVQKSKRRTPNAGKKLKKKSSPSATVSSSGSEANAKLSEDSAKRNSRQKPISSSGSSGLEGQDQKQGRRMPKKKGISKSNKKAKLQLGKAANLELGSRDDGKIHFSDGIEHLFNETLRWSNVCSDSEEEDERLRIYKENRRKRYVEAMHVKVVQKMSEFNQK